MIKVEATAEYDDSKSDPKKRNFVFRYAITIHNNTSSECQLLQRNWQIYNGHNGMVESVNGQGVVGELPYIDAGESYSYESWVKLSHPTGHMEGSYLLQNERGERLVASVPKIDLCAFEALN